MTNEIPIQPPMFGDVQAIELAKPVKHTPTGHKLHAAMIRRYGAGPEGQTCRGCKWLRRNGHSRSYLKCGKTLMTNGPASDWRLKWPACGQYDTKESKDARQSDPA